MVPPVVYSTSCGAIPPIFGNMDFSVINKEKWAYLAGIIDGEGTITITKHAQYKRSSYQYKPYVIVSNTNEQLMIFLINTFGGKYHLHEKRNDRGCLDCFRWQVMSKYDINLILRNTLEFLIIKHRQAELVLDYLTSRKNQIINKSVRYTDFDHQCHLEIRKLNERGMRKQQLRKETL